MSLQSFESAAPVHLKDNREIEDCQISMLRTFSRLGSLECEQGCLPFGAACGWIDCYRLYGKVPEETCRWNMAAQCSSDGYVARWFISSDDRTRHPVSTKVSQPHSRILKSSHANFCFHRILQELRRRQQKWQRRDFVVFSKQPSLPATVSRLSWIRTSHSKKLKSLIRISLGWFDWIIV
jgi:hypothetical protein